MIDASCGQDGQPLTHAARAKLVTSAAKKGGYVVRLMDGDPALFHGFAEEASACDEERHCVRSRSGCVHRHVCSDLRGRPAHDGQDQGCPGCQPER